MTGEVITITSEIIGLVKVIFSGLWWLVFWYGLVWWLRRILTSAAARFLFELPDDAQKLLFRYLLNRDLTMDEVEGRLFQKWDRKRATKSGDSE